MTTLYVEHNYPHENYLCLCDNCGEVVSNKKVEPIRDAEQRLTPGEETPAGQCPECYALVFVLTVEQARDRGIDESLISTSA